MESCWRHKVTTFILGLSVLSLGFGGLTTGVFFPTASLAAVFNVTNSTELQNALTTAGSNGEADTINIGPGTYRTGTGDFGFTYSAENFPLTIDGAGAGMTILDGRNSTRVLNISTSGLSDDSNADITVRDLTIQNGVFSALAVFTAAGAVTLTNNTFTGNVTTIGVGGGGGAFIDTDSGNVTLRNNTFNNNRFSSSEFTQGGGVSVFTKSGAIALISNTFNNNRATSSAGQTFYETCQVPCLFFFHAAWRIV